MTEQSFPVIEKPLTDDQWKSVTLGIGDGILDEGGGPYRVTLSNTGDNVTVEVDTLKGFNQAILRGFYHKMDAPVTLQVPAVTATTTYYVGLQYDPTRDVPVKLGVWTNLDYSSHKYYMLIAEIMRKPNQLLTDARLTMRRPRITPTIQVDREEDLPDPNRVLWGTRAVVWRENKEFRASWNRWSPIGGHRVQPWAMPGWDLVSATGGIIVRPVSDGWDCTFSGSAMRSAESYTVRRGGSIAGAPVPGEYLPVESQWVCGTYKDTKVSVGLTKGGQLSISPIDADSVFIENGSGFTFHFSWFSYVNPNTAS